ncbi:MAG: EexN family lipoprotein [Burkholderiales bacterium]|jgi:hypothetical protein|nr:EexN family lipoprotein [Burkholderiales bacterium]
MRFVFFVLFVPVFLFSCKKENIENIKTAEYYLSNEEELEKKLKECRNSANEPSSMQECINAEAANYKRFAF